MQEVILIFIILSHPIINEVMSNPRGRESSSGDKNEFVEIYNPDSVSINLTRLMLSDGDEIDTVVPFVDSSILNLYPGVVISCDSIPPQGYGIVIDREYLDSSDVPQPYSFPEGAVLFTTQDNDIGNGLSNNDPIYLINFDWDTLDIYGTPSNPMDSLPINPPDGVSVERINPYLPDQDDNWGLSTDSTGSTPGRRNSLTIWFDLGITEISHSHASIGETMLIEVGLMNYGLNDVDSFEIGILSNCFDTTLLVHWHLVWHDSATINLTTPVITEQFLTLRIFVYLNGDENPANDTLTVLIPINIPPIVINEVMYKDTVEWVEIYNNTESEIDLKNFRIKDASTHTSSSLPIFYLQPHGFLVLTGDSALLKERFPGVSNFLEIENFPTLNNNYDDVILIDAGGNSVDSLHYSSSWGGGEGVSLERISSVIATNLRDNWGSSRACAGATPGKPNSLSHFEVQSKMMQLSSKILILGQGNFVIKLNVKPSDKIILYVFDLKGRLVRKLIDGESGKFIASWDGKNKWGENVQKGLYILYCATETKKEKAVIMVK